MGGLVRVCKVEAQGSVNGSLARTKAKRRRGRRQRQRLRLDECWTRRGNACDSNRGGREGKREGRLEIG